MKKHIRPNLTTTVLALGCMLPGGFGATAAWAQTPPGCDAAFDTDGRSLTVTCGPGQVDSEDSFLFRNAGLYSTYGYVGEGDDTLNMEGGTIVNAPGAIDPDSLPPGLPFDPTDGTLEFGAGNDTVNMRSGAIGQAGNPVDIFLGDGDDTFDMSGGTFYGDIYGNGGDDSFLMSGGMLTGNIVGGTIGSGDGNTFLMSGGTLNGNVSDLTSLTIDDSLSPAPIQLTDGIVFSGTDAIGTIRNTDLAASGGSQNFTGLSTLFLTGSAIRFGGDQTIDSILAENGSTIFTTGNRSVFNQSGTGLGSLSLVNSSLNMVNGAATDSLSVGGLNVENSSILVDYDQQGAAIDHISVAPGGVTTVSGANLIQVNLLGTPILDQATDVAVIQSDTPIDPSLFTIQGISGTPSSLYDYTLVGGAAGGGVVLRATPTGVFAVGSLVPTSNTSTLDLAIAQLYDIASLNVASALGLSSSASTASLAAASGKEAAPFGVFATGQLARTHYDGFEVVGTGATTPSYSSTERSVAASLDWNASEYFGFDQQYGLNIGVFGGFAASDVDLGSFLGFNTAGSADNKSGLFGAYTLFRKERSYLVFSAIGLLGNTDVTNALLGNSIGSYDTRGFAATLSVGHIFSLTDSVRLDLRGGVLAARFTGDDYTDSLGVNYGKSKVSFGGFKFEPGIYADHKLDNGMSVSPYLRAEFQQLFGYENTASAGGKNFEFDTAGFSAALSGGVNLQVSKATTLSTEVKVKTSADSHSLAGKLGVKVAF